MLPGHPVRMLGTVNEPSAGFVNISRKAIHRSPPAHSLRPLKDPPLKPCPLLEHPCWQAADLGKPLPDSEHATSVAMPLWEHVIQYEEGDETFRRKLSLGYPRFVIHPHVARLNALAMERFAGAGEGAFVAPSARVAQACQQFLRDVRGVQARLEPFGGGVVAVVYPGEAADSAKHFWQHFGEIVSSRRAKAVLEGRPAPADDGAKARLRAQIAGLTGCAPEDVYLYSTGMAALAAALRISQRLTPGARSIQLGFPYVDGLKIQTVWGPGAHFFPTLSEEELDAAARLLASGEPVSAVFCEVVGNPLLRMADVPRIAAIARPRGIPVVVDDTVATFANVDLLPHADLISSSLTKHFSGTGDVMAGSLIINPRSPRYAELKAAQAELFEDLFWAEDATVLAENAADFNERIARINASTEVLCDELRGHPAVAELHYPKYVTNAAYERVKRPGGGYGGLFSLVLKDAARTAAPYFDQLRVSKGPSLGTNFTLACPYTLLAHYDELDWAESLGISRYLIRVSVGLEELDDLRGRFLAGL